MFKFLILEISKSQTNDAKKNIDEFSTFLIKSGLTRFKFWSSLALESSFDETLVAKAAQCVDLNTWDVGPGDLEAATLFLRRERKKCQKLEVLDVDLPYEFETPDEAVRELLRATKKSQFRGSLNLYLRNAHTSYQCCDHLLAIITKRLVWSYLRQIMLFYIFGIFYLLSDISSISARLQ